MKQLTPPYAITTPYPLSVNRYWRKFKNHMLISKEGKRFKSTVQAEYAYLCKPVATDVSLSILIHPKLNKNGSASKVLIDLDNSLKCILDSLIRIVYLDDKQVKQLIVSYGNPIHNGGATINVEELKNKENKN